MRKTMSFKKALLLSLLFHFSVIVFVFYGPKSKSDPIIMAMVVDEEKTSLNTDVDKNKVIEAINISSVEVEQAVEKLKQEQAQAEQARQDKIAAEKLEAEQAKRRRITEERRLAALKKEAKKRAEQQRIEKQRLAQLQKEQEKLLKQKQEQERQQQLEKERKIREAKEAERRRAEAQQAAKEKAERQARINTAVQKYKALIINAISQQWILPATANSQLSCEFRIRLAPDGTVVLAQLSRSSGDSVLDRSAETAINKASPLPIPKERDLFELFRDIQLTVRPEQARG